MEEIKVADTARYVSFYAYDSADHISPADGITSFTVYFYLNNGSVTGMAPAIVTEKDSTNMKGWYTLAVDDAPMVSSEGVLSINIEATGMDPVAIKVKIVGNTTKEVYDRVGAAGANLTDLGGMSTGMKAEVNAEADTALSDYGANTTTPPTATAIIDAWETQSQADPTGFHVNVKEVNGTAQTANDNGSDINDILDDTAEIGAAGAGLTALGDTRIANLDTTVSSRLAPAGTLATVTNLTNAPTNGDLTATMKTSVNDQVVDVIKTDTSSEMSQGAPPASPTIEEMLAYNYFKMRNKQETTASEDAIYNNAGDTKLFKSTISDNGTTFTKQEYGSGA